MLGGVWWGLDFPFMKRHSADYLARHPEARDQDWETTRRICARFRDTPTTLLNFLEGTRFRPDKQARQQSPTLPASVAARYGRTGVYARKRWLTGCTPCWT